MNMNRAALRCFGIAIVCFSIPAALMMYAQYSSVMELESRTVAPDPAEFAAAIEASIRLNRGARMVFYPMAALSSSVGIYFLFRTGTTVSTTGGILPLIYRESDP